MINILKCNDVDLKTLIEINTNEINNLKNSSNVFPFMIGDINRLQKENEQISFLINYLNNK